MKKFCMIVNQTTNAEGFDTKKISDYIEAKGGSAGLIKTVWRDGVDFTETFHDFENLDAETAAVLVFGGDGTIIRAARGLAGSLVPLLGINMGTMGFLAEVEVEKIYSSIDKIFLEDYMIKSHLMLKGRIMRGDEEIYSSIALNDIVLARSYDLRVIATEIRIDGTVMSSFLGDGVVVCTPTGSTGYNLSAGGTIVMPDTDIFEITPICPHSFQARGIVTNSDAKITLSFVKAKKTQTEEALVSFDGNDGIKITTGDRIEIERAEESVNFIRFEDFSFLNTLNSKMKKA